MTGRPDELLSAGDVLLDHPQPPLDRVLRCDSVAIPGKIDLRNK